MLKWDRKRAKIKKTKNQEYVISDFYRPLFQCITTIIDEDENKSANLQFSLDNPDDVPLINAVENDKQFGKNSIESNFQANNLLFLGDNASVLSHLAENGFKNTIDLVYIDPPFMTNTNFYKDIRIRKGKNNKKKAYTKLTKQKQYNDKWEIDEYLSFLYQRLLLIKTLLKPTGSIYLHLDENCVHYIKVIMDEIFGMDNFRRDITWNTASLNVAGFKGQVRDNWIYGAGHILFYTMSDTYTFNTQFIPRSKDFIKRKYQNEDEKGRYRITRRNNKIYLKDDKGEPMINIWNDILSFNYAKIASKESVFYPTQKPEKLISRIIKASSNPGDTVLDCFMGSGTTLAVAEKLHRRWFGCDINPVSVHIASKRLQRIVSPESRRKFLIYKPRPPKENPNIENLDIFKFDVKRNGNEITIIISEVKNDNILRNLNNCDPENDATLKILEKGKEALAENHLEKYSLCDSIFIELYAEKSNDFFHIHYSDVPKKRDKSILGRYRFKVKTEDNFRIRIKLVDIFGQIYISKTKQC
ncbi:MAG: hypothetical protein GF364_21195 [Candidatus Lokiarchaeota archaeon]|nr:hypothetical protein [Candidatus Lokiarchaeota archaeon]